MTKQLFKFGLLFLLPIWSIGQNVNYNVIVRDFCDQADSVSWSSNSRTSIQSELISIAEKIKIDYKIQIEQGISLLKTKNPNVPESEITKKYLVGLTKALLDSCDNYLSLTKQLLAPCPSDNPTLKLVAYKVDSIVANNQHLSYSEQLKNADNKIFMWVIENENLILDDYADGFADPKLPREMGIYLLHKCPQYFRSFILKLVLESF